MAIKNIGKSIKQKQIKDFISIIILLLLLLGIMSIYNNMLPKKQVYIDEIIICDFEHSSDTGQIYTNIKGLNVNCLESKIIDSISNSGNNSLKINSWQQYQSLIKLGGVKGSKYLKVSLSIKKGSDAYLVLEGVADKNFYYISNINIGNPDDDWKQIEIEVFTETSFNDSLAFYVFNSAFQETYIDDFKIEIKKEKKYPEFKEIEPLLIYIQQTEFEKLEAKRNEALKKGVLITEDDSYVKALIYIDGKMIEAEMRLKGDWLDHLSGDKWSYRIKLKEGSWNGMSVFSIHTPKTRAFLNEWLLHKEFLKEDLLTSRYGFVPVYINGKSYGLYAYEEHFQKELIESNKRREGLVIKFSEAGMWDFMRLKMASEFSFESSVIEPFGKDKTLSDSAQFNTFLVAQNLLECFRNMSAPASEIFDVDKTAKFYALLNSRNAFHALEWHNIRYYYNPVLSRLEPIGFDMFAGESVYHNDFPISFMPDDFDCSKLKASTYYLISDTSFANSYLKYLRVFTSEKHFSDTRKEFINSYSLNDQLLKKEFSNYNMNIEQFDWVTTRITSLLPAFCDSLSNSEYQQKIKNLANMPMDSKRIYRTDIVADKYINCFKQNEKEFLLKIFLNDAIIIQGFGTKEKLTHELNIEIQNNNPDKALEKLLSTNTDLTDCEFLYFKLALKDSVFMVPISKWPAPTKYNPRTDIASNSMDLTKYTNQENKQIVFTGKLKFKEHIYIPKGYTVVINPGTEIDLVNGSAFISNSGVLLNGTKENPIKISSSDKSAMGFTILQASNKSVIKYTEFSNLNTINYNDWILTGAVVFYESDVEISNSIFSDNYSEDMINTIRCDFYIHDCIIKNTFGDSHDSDFCTGIVKNCKFINAGNDAIDFSTSNVEIISCDISGCVDKGISIGENSKARISTVNIENVNIGISSKDLSSAELDNVSINNAVYGFVIMQKKPEFGPAFISANNCKLSNVGVSSLIEKGSSLKLNGVIYQGKKPRLFAMFYE